MEAIISVCFIDDEENLNEIYAAKLGNYYLVRTFTSATEALAEIQKGYRPNVVVTDLKMPQFSGMHFLQSLEDLHLSFPVIAITGFLEPIDIKMLAPYNVFAILEKPFLFDDLKLQIDAAVHFEFVESHIPESSSESFVELFCDTVCGGVQAGYCSQCKVGKRAA